MAKVQKVTVRKKMATRDYMNMLWWLETGEMETNLDKYDPKSLAEVKTFYMRVTPEVRDKIDEYIGKISTGISFKAFADKMPIKTLTPDERLALREQRELQQLQAQAPTVNTDASQIQDKKSKQEQNQQTTQTTQTTQSSVVDISALPQDKQMELMRNMQLPEFYQGQIRPLDPAQKIPLPDFAIQQRPWLVCSIHGNTLDGVPSCICKGEPIRDGEEQRKQLYKEWKQDRQPLTEQECIERGLTLADYPFIIDPNIPFEADNIDFPIMYNAIAEHVMGCEEVGYIAKYSGRLMYYQDKIDGKFRNELPFTIKENHPQTLELALKSYWQTGNNRLQQLIKESEEQEQKYLEDEDVLVDMYYEYLLSYYYKQAIKAMRGVQGGYDYRTDFIEKVNDKSIDFSDNDGKYKSTVEYDNADDMRNDLFVLSKPLGLDLTEDYKVFGKKFNIYNITKDLCNKYPQGMPDCPKFYRTLKERYDDWMFEL